MGPPADGPGRAPSASGSAGGRAARLTPSLALHAPDRALRRASSCGAALVAVALACLALTAAVPGSLDDAFVVLVEARHLAEHGAFRSDLDGQPISGATSLLDVLQKAALIAAGAPDALAAAGWLGLCWLAAAAGAGGALALGLARGAGKGAGVTGGWALVGAVALAPGVVEGTSFFLETPLFAALWTALLASVAGGRGRTAFALAAALPLARPEGYVLGPAAWFLAARAGGHSAARLARGAAGLGVVLATQVALRWAHLGSPWPNSYYAKRSDSRLHELRDGLGYGAEFVTTWPGLALCVAGLAAFAAWRRPSLARGTLRPSGEGVVRTTRDLALLGLLALFVTVVSGGDAYGGARLLAPATLALWLSAAAALPLARGVARAALVAAAVASGLLGLAPALAAPVAGVRGLVSGPLGLAEFEPDAAFVAAVERALATAPEGPGRALAHRHAQRFAWFAQELELRDLTGLTDREIARLPAPGPVRFGRDALDFVAELGVGAIHLDHRLWHPRPWWAFDVASGLSPEGHGEVFVGAPLPAPSTVAQLAARYRLATLEDAWGAGRHVNLLVRRDLAQAFRAAGFTVGE